MHVQGISPRLSRGFVCPWKLGKLRNNLKGNKSFCQERNGLPNLKAAEAVYTKAEKRHVACCFRLFTPRNLDICSPHLDKNKLSFNIENSFLTNHSPIPELHFLPAPYRGSTQDNLHAHAQNDAIFSPQIGGKTRLIKNMSINPKSVEFHQFHANPRLICLFLSQYQR